MKPILIILLIALLLTTAGCASIQTANALPQKTATPNQPCVDPATITLPPTINLTTLVVKQQTLDEVRALLGQEVETLNTVFPNSTSPAVMYLFKKNDQEIRVYFNSENKVDGIMVGSFNGQQSTVGALTSVGFDFTEEGRESPSMEVVRLRHKTEKNIWVDVNLSAILDCDGWPTSQYGIFHLIIWRQISNPTDIQAATH